MRAHRAFRASPERKKSVPSKNSVNMIDIKDMKKHISEVDDILADEDFELSDYAKKALKEARNTPEEEYSTLE